MNNVRTCANCPRLAAQRAAYNAHALRVNLAPTSHARAELAEAKRALSSGRPVARPTHTIPTAHGPRVCSRVVGAQSEYAFTLPTAAAPHGEWWVLNPQRGWVPVASNSNALRAAIARDEVAQ